MSDQTHRPGLGGRLEEAGRLALATPPSRNRYVDLLRAVSILVVVVGHWLMAAPTVLDDGTLRAGHLLSEVPWTGWLTWLLQVMPVFFFVGGYANAASWRAAARDAVPYASWLRERLRRLLVPVVALLGVWTAAAPIVLALGVGVDLLRIGSQAALVPVWFLAVYVVVVMATPVTLRMWERRGWAAVAAVGVAAGAIDVASLGLGIPGVGWANHLLVWTFAHLLGHAWADGRLGGVGARAAVAAGGLAGLAALVRLGPYPVAMVGLDGAAVTNSNPPKVTLVALALFQFGLAMAFESPARRLLARPRPWRAVVLVNGRIMTLYLWHLTALVAVAGGALLAAPSALAQEPGSAGWWATRPLWIAALSLATVPFLSLFGRFERPSPDPRPAPPPWRPVLAVLGASAGLGLLASGGIADAEGLHPGPVALALAGLVLGGILPLGRAGRASSPG